MAVKKPPVLIEIANTIEPVHDGCLHIEKRSGRFYTETARRRAEYSDAGLRLAIERGWLVMRESGTFVKFTQAGADLFA